MCVIKFIRDLTGYATMVEFYLMSNRLIIILLMLKLQQQVDELTQYIRTILLEGVDISALYIIEAQLTVALLLFRC